MRREALLLVGLLPLRASAQGVSLQYHPPAGSALQIISDNRMTTIVFGLPSLPDSTVVESDWRTVRSVRVTEATADKRKVRITLDSIRARARAGTNQRVDVPLPVPTGLAVEAVIGGKLDLVSAAPVQRMADMGFVAAATALLGGLEFQLPDAPLAAGLNWASPMRFPFGAHLTTGGRLASVESLQGAATVVLDSISARGADTLAFLSLSGALDPKTIAIAGDGGVGTGSVSGRVAAALVWSTGWNAVVSAATNGRFEMRFHLDRAEGPPVNGSASMSTSARTQVRL